MNDVKTKSKVFYTDFRCKPDEGPADKLKRLIKAAGMTSIDLDGKFVAIKMHFGELGNLSFLRPNYARAVVDLVKQCGGKPFLTDCNTLYPGSRKNAIEHLYCAWENGFTPLTRTSVWDVVREQERKTSIAMANRLSTKMLAAVVKDVCASVPTAVLFLTRNERRCLSIKTIV